MKPEHISASRHASLTGELDEALRSNGSVPHPAHAYAPPQADHRQPLANGLLDMVEQGDFPCVGAKAALAGGNLAVETAAAITCPADDLHIHDGLVKDSRTGLPDQLALRSFAVVFAGPRDLDEVGFEAALWERINALTAIDRARGFKHHPAFGEDPHDPDFALSFGGRAYFVVGLHPRASRRARRAPSPTMVFNRHDQFKRLRKAQKYERMREVILKRDAAFDGRPNPMLARHGEVSEARQYSGRAVGKDWVCPFAPAQGKP